MGADFAVYLTIGLMALIVQVTRIAGAEFMTAVSVTPRIRAFLKSMAMSVLVAIVASQVARGGLREGAAVLLAIAVMYFWKNMFGAIIAAVLFAAAWSQIVAH